MSTISPESIPETVIRTKEGIFVLKDDTHLSRWIEEHGRLDIAEEELNGFRKFVPESGSVIDAGASLGDHALTYAKWVGPTGCVLAFEPNFDSWWCACANLEEFPQVTVINQALSDENRKASMVHDSNVGASHLLDDPDGSIQCRPLDDFIYHFNRLDFIHLDLEGYELKALYGAQKLISKFRPVLLIELNKGRMAATGMTEIGVRDYFDSMNYLVSETVSHHNDTMDQRDILATPL